MLVARVITVTYIKQNRDSSANMASGGILPHFFKWPKYGKAIREKTLFFCNKDLEVRQGKMKKCFLFPVNIYKRRWEYDEWSS